MENQRLSKLFYANTKALKAGLLGFALLAISACDQPKTTNAASILGNPDYQAIAYGGYRNVDRSQAPSKAELKEDLKILHAMGIRVLRTYHARLYEHAPRLLAAISEMKSEDPNFEMYIMLGAWIQCEGAWTDNPQHLKGDVKENKAEIDQAIRLAQQYPDIVKVIAVGNESMVHWAASYHVHPRIVLKWVQQLQGLKAEGILADDLWITSSDNFASWGGEGPEYHVPALDSLLAAVDYLSVHSYPFHDSHYNPQWWQLEASADSLKKDSLINVAIQKALDRVQSQLTAVASYVESLGLDKKIHIGESGWASGDNHLYGDKGSHAADEYKQMLYYQGLRKMADSLGMSCFYFEAFDEPWKDGQNPAGSENHFGLFTVDGEAKMPIWDLVDQGLFEGLSRAGNPIQKSHQGNGESLRDSALIPPYKSL